MIDLAYLRENKESVTDLLLRKEPTFPVALMIELDGVVRALKVDVENLRKTKNDLAQRGAHGDIAQVREQSIMLGKQLKEKETALQDAEQKLQALWHACPNIPVADMPVGNKEANKSVREYGQKPTFDFQFKNHVELNEKLGWFDMESAATMSGSGFVFYREMGTKMIYALTRLMLKNNAQHGFKPMLPPYLIREEGLFNPGNLPKFAGDFYELKDEKLCLIPTAEVSLTNLYVDKILKAEEIPVRMTAWTSCFRREAGTYGSTERGLIRIHQFEKVELYSICEPEKSFDELEYMVGCAEKILQMLGLHYRVSFLATQDCSFPSAKTYDIEVWLPGQNRYYEVSSCSNCTDFQSRRSRIRYRKNQDAKPTLVHTLNASSLALPRLMVALMENNQQADGSIKLPAILEQEMNALW